MAGWLKQLLHSGDAETLRRALADRHPSFLAPARLAIVGAADEGQRLAGLCRTHGIEIVAIADDNPTIRGRDIAGVGVRPVEDLSVIDRKTPVVIASHRTLKATQRLRAMGFVHVAPFALLQTLTPAKFPPHPFYDGWLGELATQREQYRALAAVFADDASRNVLDAVLGYRLTCDPTILAPIVEWDIYGAPGLVTYGSNEVYIDGGSYDGDSVRWFIDRVGGCFDRVLAFEPDPATFARLCANFRDEPRVQPIRKGLYSHTAVLRFDGAGTRASSIVAGSGDGIEVPVTSIDEVLGDERVSLIKMNIEGAEQAALRGAARAIARWRPKLVISVYHRPADLWEIPALVRELEPRYRLYLRQHDGGVIETVLYALP